MMTVCTAIMMLDTPPSLRNPTATLLKERVIIRQEHSQRTPLFIAMLLVL
jgi:hypothetical protein